MASTLTEHLQQRIRREGPITFRDWMEAALYDPDKGYYCRRERQRWGREGDYRTSPERSVLFAATFARYFAKLYQELGAPAAWTILEAGAGGGHFAAGLLETLQRRMTEVFLATRYVIDEVSDDSAAQARELLAKFGTRVQFKRLAELDPINTGIIFSNELLDALPVHRVTTRAGKLCELYVAVNNSGAFEWLIGPPSTIALTDYFEQIGIRLAEGQIAEANLELERWYRQIAEKLVRGYVITVDYGAEARQLYVSTQHRQGTLRAFQRHQFADNVLARPGEQDMTTTVDWTCVKRLSRELGFDITEFEQQDRFLLDAGLLQELELRTGEATDESEGLRLRTSAREMILPGRMASSFQVLVQRKGFSNTART